MSDKKIFIKEPKIEYQIKRNIGYVKEGQPFTPQGFVFASDILKIVDFSIADLSVSSFEELNYFENLECLNISNNLIDHTIDLSSLSKLREFYCTNIIGHSYNITGMSNTIETLHCNYEHLEMLIEFPLSIRALDLKSCKSIDVLPPKILECKNLEYLDASMSGLSDISSLGALNNLKGLNLSKNKISVLPDNICDLINMERLNINRNPLKLISERFLETFKVVKDLAYGYTSTYDENYEEQDFYLAHRSISDTYLHRNDCHGINITEVIHEWELPDLITKINENYTAEDMPSKRNILETGTDGLPF